MVFAAGKLLKDCDEEILIHPYIIEPPSYKVVLSWVKSMCFFCDTVQKSYYSDGHEKTEQKKHRSHQHTNLYLTELEPRCRRWISILPSELAMMNAKLDLFDPEDGVAMIEFHVDNHVELQKLAEEKYPGFTTWCKINHYVWSG